MIKNISILEQEIKDFSLQKIESITGFHLDYENRSFRGQCILDIEFLIHNQGKPCIACFRFHNPNSIKFESGGMFQQLAIEFYDISDRGWENKKFEVIDSEDNALHFYCSEIEIISLRETQPII